MTRPAVASVMLGCSSGAKMLDALKYINASEEEKDYSHIYGTLRNDFRGNCVYCSLCQPCPFGVTIMKRMSDAAELF